MLLASLVFTGCSLRLPRPGEVSIRVKSTTRVQTQVRVQGQVQVEAPLPPPAPPVALQGAAVVEFFGIPLQDAQDVVFVLDCSGSMEEAAQGRLAQIQTSPPPPDAQGSASVPPPDAQGSASVPPPPPDAQATGSASPPPAAPPTPRKIDVAKAELVDALEKLPAGTRMNVVFFNSELEAFAPSLVPLDENDRAGLIAFVKETEPTGSTALAPAMRTAFTMDAHRVVLLSDGLGNVGGNSDAVLRDAREAMHGGVRIDTIGLGRGQDGKLLSAMANESGGLYQAL